MVEHSTRKHALLSASGAGRWMSCPPSARMEEALPEDSSSSFAEEGTLAHEFADLELRLKTYVGPVGKGSPKQKLLNEKKAFKKHELYSPEMDGFVEVYVDYVLEEFAAARKGTLDAVLSIEERSDFSHIVPDGFGTSDANIVADKTLEICDLKYGKGVQVFAENNPQMRLYALGILKAFSLLYDISTVKMTIIQPRLYHIDSEEMSVEALEAWAEDYVKPAAAKAWKGEGECNPGDWCRWCKAKPTCRAIADFSKGLAKRDFAEPEKVADIRTLSDIEVAETYGQLDILLGWAASVKAHLLKEAVKGKTWPGYKLVEGKSNRKIKNEEEAIRAILAVDGEIQLKSVTNTKIKGIGDLEKLLTKPVFNALNLTVKPAGAPTLAPESDNRPAWKAKDAKKEFA